MLTRAIMHERPISQNAERDSVVAEGELNPPQPRWVLKVRLGRLTIGAAFMGDATPAPRDVTPDTETSQRILDDIRRARETGSRAGQIKAARDKGFTFVGISAAGVIGK